MNILCYIYAELNYANGWRNQQLELRNVQNMQKPEFAKYLMWEHNIILSILIQNNKILAVFCLTLCLTVS